MAKSTGELHNENKALTKQVKSLAEQVKTLSSNNNPKSQSLESKLLQIHESLKSYKVLQQKHEVLKNESKNGIVDELKYLMDKLPIFIHEACNNEEGFKEKLDILEIFPNFKFAAEKISLYLSKSCSFLPLFKDNTCAQLQKSCNDLSVNNNALKNYLNSIDDESTSVALTDTKSIIEGLFKFSKETCDNKEVIKKTLENFKEIQSIDPIINKLDTYLYKYCDLSVSFEDNICVEVDTFCNYDL